MKAASRGLFPSLGLSHVLGTTSISVSHARTSAFASCADMQDSATTSVEEVKDGGDVKVVDIIMKFQNCGSCMRGTH